MSKKNKTAPQASNDSKKPTNSVRDKSPVAVPYILIITP